METLSARLHRLLAEAMGAPPDFFDRQGAECGIYGVGFRALGLGFRVPGFGVRVWGLGFIISDLGSRIPGFGIRVWGLGFRF